MGGEIVGKGISFGQRTDVSSGLPPSKSAKKGSIPVAYTVVGVATDDDGGERNAELVVFVETPPAFAQKQYAFDLSENLDGRATPVELGVMAATDPNPGDELTYSISSGSDHFVIDGTSGMLSYVGPGEDFESVPFFYDLTIQATDQTGRTGLANVRVTITDANDAAVIGGVQVGAVTEDDTATASGTLTVNDPDANQDAFKAQTDVAGTYGTFMLSANGAWTYTLDNDAADTDALGAGQTGTDTFEVASADGTTAQVVITVTGSDDAAVIGGDLSGAVTEDDARAATASGTVDVSDVDTTLSGAQRRFMAQTEVAGTYGTFTLNANGAWTYTLNNADPDTDALVAGQTETDTFEVASTGGTTAQVVITVTGSDDAVAQPISQPILPRIVPPISEPEDGQRVIGGDLTGTVTEDAQETQASGTLTASDADAGQDAFTAQTDAQGTYGTFTLDANGAWTYTLDNTDTDTDALRAGQTGTERFLVVSTGGIRSEVVVTVTGSDDAAVIGGDSTGAVTEDDAQDQASGTLTVSDPDAREEGFRISGGGGRTVGLHGVFTLEADGDWTYTLDNASANALVAGQTVTERFVVFSTGGTKAQVVVTVTGANDAAVIGGTTTGAVTEDDTQDQASGTLTVSDADAGQDAFTAQTDAQGTYGTFTLDTNGAWTYTLDNMNAATDALVAGQTETDTFTVASADGTTAQVVVTVTGSDDAAVIGGTTTGALTEDADETEASGTLTVNDPDANQDAFTAQTGEKGKYGTFMLDADGAWTYTLDNSDPATDALVAGQTETETFTVASADGTTAQVVVTVTGSDDAAVIGGDLSGAVTEDDARAATASGTVDVSDVDTTLSGAQRRFMAQTEVAGTYGTFTLNANGAWTYTLNNADGCKRRGGHRRGHHGCGDPDQATLTVSDADAGQDAFTDALVAGQTETDTFEVASTGGTTAQVVVTVTGANDAAVIGGATTGAVTEDDTQDQASGTLTVSDADAGQDAFTAQTDAQGTYGTFTLDANGAWTYTLDNSDPATDALVAGQTETDTFTVASADGTTAQVVVTVTGANDAAVIGGTTTGAVTEDAPVTEASGTLTASDSDAGAIQNTFTAQTDVAGTYGTFTLGANGAWTYTLDNTDADTDALGAGEKVTDTFEVASADGTTAQVVVTVTGANDAAVIGGDSTGAVTEDAQETEASGTLTVKDPDADQDAFTAQTDAQGTYGTFTLDANGAWTYTLDNSDPATDALVAGQTETDTFTVASADGTTAQVVVTVTGANDAAVIGGTTTGAVTEDAPVTEASGTLTASDSDAGAIQNTFTAQTDVAGTYGTFTLGANGAWTYTLDNTDADTDALGAGEKVTDTFEVASADGTTAQVMVTVTGANDAAVIGGDSTGAVTEDAQETEASGTLTVKDPDADQDAFTAQTDVAGTYGTFTLGEDGAWTYTLDNDAADTDALGAGEKVTDTFEVASADGTTAQVVVTVTGANDAAVIGGDSTGAVTEDAQETEASGTLTVKDPDADQDAFTAQTDVAGTYGTFTLGEDGAWTYTLDNDAADTDALGAGEKVTDTFEVASADGTTAQVVVTVTGANDAAVIGGDSTGAVTEDAQETEASGTLTVKDPDADQDAFTAQTDVAGTYGTFTLGEDGAWTYTLDNDAADTDALGAGEKVTDTFEVASADGTTAQVVITVTGSDDAAVIGGTSTGAVTEDAQETQASGTLTVKDPDADQDAFTAQTDVAGTYGTFTLGEDGAWTYTLDNDAADTDALGAGEKVTDTFEVASADGTTAQVMVTVTGSDDAAVIGGDSTGAVTEDAQETQASGTLTVKDPDADQDAFTAQTDVAGTYGTFTLGANGAWTYTLDNTDADTDALGAGEKVTDTFEVASADGTTAQVVVTVTGSDDAAVIGGDSTGAVTEDAQETQASGTLTVKDPDADQDAFTAQTDVAGTYGTFTLGANGAWTYTLDNTDADTDALGAGEKVTDTFEVASADGTTAQVMVTVTGANDAAVIGGDSTGAVTEDAQETEASGTLTVKDPDADQDAFTAQTDVAGTYGTFTLGANGAWTYTLDNTDADTDALGAGEKVTDTFEVASADGTTAQVMVTVTGANDAAVIGGDSTGAVTEDAQETEASGTLTVKDPDADQDAFTAQTDVAGTYGTFTLGANGAWTYTLDNTDADTDALGAGEKVTDTFEVASADGTTAQVVVTVTGANDAAVIGGDSTGAVTEDAQETEASGTLTVKDPDADQDAFTAQTDVAGTYGTFTLGEDGAWTYTLDNDAADTDALGAGEKVTDTFEVASADGTTAQVVVTVTGANDAAVIGGDSTGAVTEDAQETQASGTLTVKDPDADQDAFTAQTDVAGTYGTFTLGEDGAWTYTLDNDAADTDALGAGEKVTDTFEVASADGTTAQVVITVTGSDDAAVIGGTSTGAVTEDAQETEASGTLTVKDPDADQDAFTAQTDVAGTYGTFTLGANGAWTYTLDNDAADTDALGAGEKVTDTFTVASADGTTAQVVITVTGSDDAAVIGGTSTGAVTEDAQETEASGTLTVKDPDADQDAFTAQTDVAGTYGTFTLGEDGAWTYTLDNEAADTDALGAGEKVTDTFEVASADGTTAQVVVTVTGANDAAVIGGDSTGAVTEDAQETEASGTLTVKDPDADQDAFTAQTDVAGTYGTFTLGEDGAWTYTLDNDAADTDALGAGEKVTDTFEVASADGTTAQVMVTVTGANDAAVIGGDSTGAVTEDAQETEASGTLTVKDPDADQDAFTAQTDVAGTYGTFTLGEDGAWTYTLDNDAADTDALGAGEKVTDTFEVASADGTTAQVVITVTGSDDAAVIGGTSTGAVTEDATETEASGTLTVSDVDGADTFRAQADVEGTYGTFTLEANGVWTYTLDNAYADTDALGAGEKVTDTFEVASADGTTAQVVVTVTGANDAAVIGGDSTGAVTEDAQETEASGTLTVKDPDADQDAFTAQTDVAGTYGTFTLGEDGAWTYTLDNDAADTDALGAGREGDGHVRGRERGRHHGAGGHHGDGVGRRGGHRRDQHGRGDRGRAGDRGEWNSDREGPGCGSGRVHGADGCGGDVRDVHARCQWSVDVHAGQPSTHRPHPA